MANDENSERFDSLASEWDRNPAHVETARAVFEAIIAALSPSGGEDALEFGCGTGLLSIPMAKHVKMLVAMDSSTAMLAALEQKCSTGALTNVMTIHGDAPDAFPEGPFDFVFSSLALHHIKDSAALLRASFAHLRPGGHIAFADLDAEDGSFHGDAPGVFHRGFGRDALGAQIEAAGFKDIAFTTPHRIDRATADGTRHPYPMFLVVARRPA